MIISILVNNGPGSFFTKGFFSCGKRNKNIKKIKLFGFKNSDLGQFCLANIELLIKKISTKKFD